MWKKILLYSFFSFGSFCFFTGLIHTIALAQKFENSPRLPEEPPIPTIHPTKLPGSSILRITETPMGASVTPIHELVRHTIAVEPDLEQLFIVYSEMYHTDKELLKKIARCESGFHADANSGIYLGMFQFAQETWITARTRMGLDTNPELRKDPKEAVMTAAFMIGHGQQRAWAGCL